MRKQIRTLLIFVFLLSHSAVFADNLDIAQKHLQNGEFKQALDILKPIAEKGDPIANRLLGIMHMRGDGVEKDFQKALVWFEKAASNQDVVAMNELGVLYYFGRGTKIDYHKAHHWFSKAAGAGHPESQSFMGDLYRFGRAVEKDYQQSVTWYKKSGQQGYPHALYILGAMYGQGMGVDADRVQSISYYKQAAALDYPPAIEMLAKIESDSGVKIRGISNEPSYGYTPDKPIHTGKRDPRRQHAYLDQLQGPNGEAISYKRTGGCAAYQDPSQPFGQAIIDCYEVTWPGLEEPKVLYINLYKSEPLWAPVGFTLKSE